MTSSGQRASAASGVRRRLTVAYTLSLTVLLLAAVVSMRAWSRHALAERDADATNRAIEMVRSFFRTELAEYGTVEPTLAHISGEFVFAEMAVEFVRPDGSLFGPSTPPLTATDLRAPIFEIVRPLDEKSAPQWNVRLRVSGFGRNQAEKQIDTGALLAVPLVALIAAFAGWLATGRALQPVGVMARAAEDIAAGGGVTRLPVSDPSDEFGRLGRRFNDLLEQRAGTLERQRRFLTDAAHELRTPIARMMSTAELQLSESRFNAGHEADDGQLALGRIHQDLQNVSTLVDELMEVARADSGASNIAFSDGYLDDIVSDSIGVWEAQARLRSLVLAVPVLEEAKVALDARLVTRLLGVLLGNAIAYTPEGGRVDVRVRCNGSEAILEVEDSGIGIDADELGRVFDRFFRGSKARQQQPDGCGLGLSIAAWIARVHSARIEMTSDRDSGTLVQVIFPLRQS